MLNIRRIIFYLFTLIYCVLCPVLILYSFGYIFNPVKKQLSQTGLIHIETIPSGADIYLGRSHYKYKTPTSINNLLPGRYQVNLRLKGHRLWSHEISIEEGKASVFNDIFILPRKLSPKILNPQSYYQNLILLREPGNFILKTSPQLKDLSIFYLENEEFRPLLKDYAMYSDFSVSDVYPQTGSRQIIVFGGQLWDKKFFLINPENKEHIITDITKLFNGRPDEIVWNVEYRNNCFILYGDDINRLDLKEMSVYPQFIEGIRGFGSSDKWLYLLEEDGRIFKADFDEPQRRLLFKDLGTRKEIFNKSRFYKIQLLEEGVLLLFGEKGDLITTVPPYEIAQNRVSGINFYKSGKRLLFWLKNIIGVADFAGQSVKNSVSSGQITIQTVYKYGKNISQCFWVQGGTHIIFRDRNQIFLLELMLDGKHHLEYIVEVKNNTNVSYSDTTGNLYYLDRKGRIAKLNIVPAGTYSFYRDNLN